MANFFKKAGRWKQQGETLTAARAVAVSDTDRKEILTELGEVIERVTGDVDQGLSYYKMALDVDPLHLPALEALERIYRSAAEQRARRRPHPQGQGAHRAGADRGHQAAHRRPVRDRARPAREGRAGLPRGARRRRANLLAMRGLERVYGQLSQWAELIKVLEMQLDVVQTERERIDVLLKIAENPGDPLPQARSRGGPPGAGRRDRPGERGRLRVPRALLPPLRQWHDLINAYDRHINATLDRQKKIELYGATAKVYADEVQDVERAIDAYLNIVDIEDTNIPALEALAKLYEKQGDAAKSIDYMTRVADLTADGKQRVEMYYRIGKQLDDKLGDRMAAQEKFEQALDLDPKHLPTLAALRVIAIDAADWDRAARYLDQEQINTESARSRAKLLVELGKLRDEMLGEHDMAVQAYELALSCDADNEDAALPLVNEYVATQQWARAEPLAEMLVKKSGKRERVEQHRLQNTLGKVLASLDKNEGALKAYQAAHHLDLTDQETMRGLADVSLQARRLGRRAHELPEGAHGPRRGADRAARDHLLQARLHQAGPGPGQAGHQQLREGARPRSVARPHARSDGAGLRLAQGLQAGLPLQAADPRQRHRRPGALQDARRDRRHLGRQGAEHPEGHRGLRGGSGARAPEPRPLHKLLQLYQKTQQWAQMVDTLQRIADIEPQPERKSKYLFTMAQLYRDKLDDQMRAVDLFNESLDLNPGYLDAFERINKILTALKEWKQLERAYRKMLHRVAGKGNTDLEFSLWHALGLIYRDRLEDRTAATESFRMAARLKPEEVQERLILADLYEISEQFDEAIVEYHGILKTDPTKVDPYRKLYRLYLEKKAYDPAWCLAAALSFLRKADDEERKFFEDYRPQGMLQVKSRMDNEQWFKNLFHEEENLFIGKIFEMIAGAALRAKIESLKAKKELPVLPPQFRQDPATSTVTFARTFGWAAQVLGVPAPLLYVRSDIQGASPSRRTSSPRAWRVSRCSRASRRRSSPSSSASTSRCTAGSTTSRRSSPR
jgi:tetratricopeptide (TPR) repeat protein